MKPLHLHVINAAPMRRLEPGKSRWGDAIWTFIIGACVFILGLYVIGEWR